MNVLAVPVASPVKSPDGLRSARVQWMRVLEVPVFVA